MKNSHSSRRKRRQRSIFSHFSRESIVFFATVLLAILFPLALFSAKPKAVCGNGAIEKAEACDDGNKENKDGCSAKCKIEKNWTCDNSSGKSACKEKTNGVKKKESARQPSPSVSPSQGKKTPSAPPDHCGNAIVDSGEECDMGTAEGLGCTRNCTIMQGWTCINYGGYSQCSMCGNAIVEPGEECDLGNGANGEGDSGCTRECKLKEGYFCRWDNGGRNVCDRCGDGMINDDEE